MPAKKVNKKTVKPTDTSFEKLFEGVTLEPEFAKKLKTIFECAVESKIAAMESEEMPAVVDEAPIDPENDPLVDVAANLMFKAMTAGFTAQKEGKGKETNPEQPGSKTFQAWNAGWVIASNDPEATVADLGEAAEDELSVDGEVSPVEGGENAPPADPSAEGDAADQFFAAIDGLTKDLDLRRILKSSDVDIATFIRTLKATANDLSGNKLAEPMIKLLQGIFTAISNDATVSQRISKSIEGGEAPVVEGEEEEVFDEEIEPELMESLVANIDTYLTYIAEQWVEENKLEVENGIKLELAEEFMGSIKKLYKEHNVTNVPTVDFRKKLEKKTAEIETKLNEQVKVNASLLKENKEFQKKTIFNEMVDDLTDTQKEKLLSLTEEIAFENKEQFAKKLGEVKNKFLGTTPVKQDTKLGGTAVLTENTEQSPRMRAYLDALSRKATFNS